MILRVGDVRAVQTEGIGLVFILYIFFNKRETMPHILFCNSFPHQYSSFLCDSCVIRMYHNITHPLLIAICFPFLATAYKTTNIFVRVSLLVELTLTFLEVESKEYII